MKKGNLLIVDDEITILEKLELILNDLADKIFVAENGLIALERIKQHEIHCVICDINMPKMNGVEVIKQIRNDKNEVPLIFYTGHGNQELMLEAVKYGAFDFLNKPNLEGLEEVVKRGLKEGYSGSGNNRLITDSFVSDYQKLLDELD